MVSPPRPSILRPASYLRLFFGETALPPEAVSELTTEFREGGGLDIGWAVATILKSRAFFSDANLGTRVLSPVDYVAGTARALEMFDPAPSTLALADWSTPDGPGTVRAAQCGGLAGQTRPGFTRVD